MSAFKAAVAADVGRTFLNPKEFGDTHAINGKTVVCVVDGDLLKERPGSNVHTEGVFLEEFVVFVATHALPHIPVVGERLRFDGEHYFVRDCAEQMGVLSITLNANET